MSNRVLKLSESVILESWDFVDKVDVDLTYTMYSPDPWYSDSEVSLNINEDMANSIVKFLVEEFKIDVTEFL